MKKEQNARPLNTHNPTLDDDYLSTASCNDCTGLTPAPMHNDFETEAYQQLFHFIPPYGPINSCSAVDDPIPPYNYGPKK